MHQYSKLPDEQDVNVPSHPLPTKTNCIPKVNRRSHKALQVLGVNPSTAKAMYILGLQDEKQLEQAYHQIWISSAPVLSNGANKRKNIPMIDRKANNKACKLLGYDPSMEKIMKVLGFQILEDVHQAVIEANSPAIIHLSPLPPLNQQLSSKPYRVLGFDPSDIKTSTTLGQVDQRPRYQRWARVIMGII